MSARDTAYERHRFFARFDATPFDATSFDATPFLPATPPSYSPSVSMNASNRATPYVFVSRVGSAAFSAAAAALAAFAASSADSPSLRLRRGVVASVGSARCHPSAREIRDPIATGGTSAKAAARGSVRARRLVRRTRRPIAGARASQGKSISDGCTARRTSSA